MYEIVRPGHPKWKDFVEKLEETCNFKTVKGKTTWDCSGDLSFARTILEEMQDVDIERTLEWFEEHGGFCDCEILLNIA